MDSDEKANASASGVFLFFFFYARQWVGDKVTVHGTHNHFIKKKIKNGSYGTIHTFKNYFATVFLVFSKISCIQMDPEFAFAFKYKITRP